MNAEYAIQTFSMTKIFPDWWGRAKVIAVDDLNLKIKKNEVYGLLGPNGSGKTTTIKMLLSLLYPTSGKSLVLGGLASETAISSRIGYLPEESYLYKYLSATETLEFYGKLFNLPANVRKERIEALLEMVGLSSVARRPIGTFSKGMARRIGLAQALINDPELLILDEPTSGLDPLGTRQIKDLIIKLAERGKTILLCSHLLADVEDVCDRIGIMYGGKMQREGEVSQLLVQSEKKQIIAEGLSDEMIENIRRVIDSENVKYEVSSPKEKLENFFIDIVASAQKSNMETSGAVSKSDVGNYLGETSSSELLDKLVHGGESETEKISEDETMKQQGETEEVAAEDKTVLDSLVTSSNVEHVKKDEAAETEKVEEVETESEDVDQSLLDNLTKKKLDDEQGQG